MGVSWTIWPRNLESLTVKGKTVGLATSAEAGGHALISVNDGVCEKSWPVFWRVYPRQMEGYSQTNPAKEDHGRVAPGDLNLGSYATLEHDFRDRIFAFLIRRCGDPILAEELAQDTFLRAWKSIETLSSHPSPEGWLVSTAKNLLSDHVRAQYALKRGGVASHGRMDNSDLAKSSLPIGDSIEDAIVIKGALDSIESQYREVINLCIISGHTTKAAAQILGIPQGTVKSRMFYGLKSLARVLKTVGYMP